MESAPQDAQNITRLLKDWSEGKQNVLDKLMPLVYDELRRQASRYYSVRGRFSLVAVARASVSEGARVDCERRT